MAQDYTNYEVVQISDADWGIQYSDGELIRGFTSRQNAIDTANLKAEETPVDALPQAEPRNLDEALVQAQSLRDDYRSFVGDNPTASEESKEQYSARIASADAWVSEYQSQNEQARRQASQKKSTEELDYANQLSNADRQRKEASNHTVNIRQYETDPAKIKAADDDAFNKEAYYQSLIRQKQAENNNSFEQSSSTIGSFIGGSRTYESFGGQVRNSESEISASSDSTIDLTRTSLGNDFGSITRNGLSAGSLTSGYGFTQTGGNTVYDMSVGVTTVQNTTDQRVKLSPKPSQRGMLSGVLLPLNAAGGLVFPYTPTISMQASANYNTIDVTHANQDFHIYKNTPSIDVTIQGVFTAQNEEEAKYLLASIHFLRVLTKMHFGEEDSNKGLPPPQVLLDGYGTHMFNGLSVIVKNYEVQLPDNVDYVSVASGGGTSKVPTMTTISVLVTVQQTPAKARSFNWDSFAKGDLMMQQKGWL